MKKSRFGPTGDFPHGKLNPTDEGALNIGVTNYQGNVVLNFGTRVKWVAMPPDQATELAMLILKHAGLKVRDYRDPHAYDGTCAFCGKEAELRPYGPEGESICFKCGMKDEETTKRKFKEAMDEDE